MQNIKSELNLRPPTAPVKRKRKHKSIEVKRKLNKEQKSNY